MDCRGRAWTVALKVIGQAWIEPCVELFALRISPEKFLDYAGAGNG